MTLKAALAALCVSLAFVCAVASPPRKSQPHVLFIVADDFGWNDVGYHQNHQSSGYQLSFLRLS